MKVRTCARAITWLLAAVASGCSHDWDALLPGSAGGSEAGGGGRDGSAAYAGTAGAGSSGGAGAGGASGSPAGGSAGSKHRCADPAMVIVEAGSGAFCIDEAEATNADYGAFLAKHPDAGLQPVVCAWNDDLTPAGTWPPPPGAGNVPASFIDWCDALAFCTAAGKRLCGGVGGGSAPFEDFGSADASEWYAACSAGGTRRYPYGDDFVPSACNTSGGPGEPVPVKSLPACEGGVTKLFDMSGNVFEWESSCAGGGQSDDCRIRGGFFNSSGPNAACDADAAMGRDDVLASVGIRCCSDAVPP